jgi:DNA polymerase-3 subunit delta'
MLDDFKLDQPIVYRVLTNSIKKNKNSHAYLFELNGYSKGLDLALAFAKFLLCPYNYTNNDKCNDCYQCHNIDTNNFLEIKVIEADGQWIKKEQLEELQHEFMTKSLIGNKKVYIINGAEKLNVASSNSLLKFLEEPPEGVIAILLTDNMYQLLNTIISRCQILSFNKDKRDINLNSIQKIANYLFNDKESIDDFINNNGIAYIDTIIEYVSFLESKKNETIIYKNKLFIELFNDRRKLNIAFQLIILYYKDILNYLLNLPIEYFNDYEDSIKNLSIDNKEYVSKIIKILVDLSLNIKYNVNANLLMDKLVIMISEVK